MDVKSKYSALSPARGPAVDARRNKDVNNKHHLETLRRRELAGANNFPNHVQPTKYNVQKTKNFVKRQRSKGQYHGGAEENSKVVEEMLPEYGSVLVQRSKKNCNHLLKFHYERDAQNRDKGRRSSNSNRLLPPVQRHKYNKEQFVQASCQFVVTASRDYSLHLTNPDILVEWKSIEQIILHNSENLSCPICLHPPVAGKMTRCGHVYCWPCILRYLRYCQETGNYKCPICDEYLHKNDLKSVIEITRSTFNLGETISLCLMRREKNSLFATPVKSAIQPPTTFLSVSENASNPIYSKLLIATVKDIVNIIECEYSELELELENDLDMASDIKQALSELSKRKEKLLWKTAEPKDDVLTKNITEREIAEETSQRYEVNSDESCNDDKSLAKQSSIDSVSSDSQIVSPSKFSYFYQAEDGQHMYLHAANVKMLEMQYGSLEHCPRVITGKLLEKEASICTEELRRRLRYLCHLPLTCPFELAEIELKPPLVSEEVLHAFHEQLISRQKYREQREREERKREKKIIEKENRQIGIYPTPNIDIESYQHFPQLQSELQLSNENDVLSPSESVMSSIPSSSALSVIDEIAPKQETDHSREQTRTFADITKTSTMPTKMSNKSANAWPAVKSKTHSSTTNAWFNKDEEVLSTRTYDKSTNAWPSVTSSVSSDTPGTSFNEDEKKSYVCEEVKDEGNTSGKKKKKKKGKGTVLFTTALTTIV